MDENYIKENLLQKIYSLVLTPLYQHKQNPFFDAFKSIIDSKIGHFSWGILYLHLKSLSEPHITESDIHSAFSFECLGLSVELLDDFLDQDNPSLNEMNRVDFIILYTELLVRGIYPFAKNDLFNYGLSPLIKSLHGEWHDLNSLLNTAFTENDYFESVIQKSTEFFSFLTYCALGKDPQHHAYETLMKSMAEMTQILNDIRGIYNPDKNDLIRKNPTLPLIKFLESDPDRNLKVLKEHSSGDISTSDLIRKIEESGAIDYCHFLLSEYKSFIINHIERHFTIEKLRPILNYFKLETWYEPLKNTH